MPKIMSFEWEKICVSTYRAKVFGGWIVNHCARERDETFSDVISESMVFIPDKDHEWFIEDYR